LVAKVNDHCRAFERRGRSDVETLEGGLPGEAEGEKLTLAEVVDFPEFVLHFGRGGW
jgi:hypothetical protein